VQGDKAIEFYQRAVDTFEGMGLDATDKNYGASLSNMGLVYEDRRDWEQVRGGRRGELGVG
jgi:hypothetical protein